MSAHDATPFRVALLATGGTIEKTYDARSGQLSLATSVIEDLLARLAMPDVQVRVERVMALDSLDMTDDDRSALLEAARAALDRRADDAIVITHGTDTLADSAALLARELPAPPVPVVFTAAMRPYRVADSDALQNVAQALMAARLLAPGVYAVCHGRVIAGARVAKDYERLTLAPRA